MVNNAGDHKSARTRLYWDYRKGSEKRGFVFLLTDEQFAELTKQDCWYCGREPSQVKRAGGASNPKWYYLYNGIDRVENGVGYTEANCVPCCGRCNKLKGSMSIEDFLLQIRKIHKNLDMF